MSKTYRNAGIGLAVLFGILAPYASLRPAFEEQKAEREGRALPTRGEYDTVLSDQMREDFREAEKELMKNEGGFAWGIRQKLFGRNPYAAGKKQEGDARGGGEEGGKG